MANELQNSRVLFISGGFYNYDEIIINQIENLGARVTYYCSAPTNNHTLMRIYQRFQGLREKYCKSLFDKISIDEFDYVFMLNTARLTDEFVQSISNRYKNSIKILYCWDAIKTIPEVKNRLKYFDRVFTFDTGDPLKNEKMNFLPLFYSKANKKTDIKYDFSFVGFGHSNRYNFIKNIKYFALKNGYKYSFNLYLPSVLYYLRGRYILKNLKGSKKSDFIFKSLTDEQASEIMMQSRIVLDYEIGTQDGLTMRTIEALGTRKKLITTNKNVMKYDFYNTNNILIVNRENPVITDEFIKTNYHELPSKVYDRYYIKNWLLYMFLFKEDNIYQYAVIGEE